MYYTIKQYTKKTFPNFFVWARDIKDQLKIEFKTINQVGISRILQQFTANKQKWQLELPVQRARKFSIDVCSLKELQKKYDVKEGGHTIYLLLSAIKDLISLENVFPDNVGVKIIKRPGGINAPFSAPDKTCKTYQVFSPSHKDLVLVHNLFYSLGMGPRLYDLIELQFNNDDVHMAYIMEHIEGKVPDKIACEHFIHKIKQLEEKNIIKLVNWNGYGDMDFTCPDCNGNLIAENNSELLKYIDLQNFALGDYYTHLKTTALQATKHSHFGDKSYIMGGKYLYQEVPGLNMAAKRSPAERFKVWQGLLSQSSLKLKNKIIIDIGCNLGLMSAQYLKEQAAWIYGFDMPNVIQHSENVLLALGCSRFSVKGVELHKNTNILQYLPDNLNTLSSSIVISYLAIRGHIGWIKDLANIPWQFMLYEGHQEEDKDQSLQYIAELNMLKPCSVVAETWVADANSSPRYMAIIQAEDSKC
jgi:hypothetical protein